MKNCPNCNALIEDNAAFCTACGARFEAENPQPQQQAYQAPPPNYAPNYAP
ncbi:MAG: zinc-ribbon domain-containing protein, partial [Clostridia bacterium]|nr:zinc-ribbon domain-containing protein [Clostridia bacterium]